MVVVVKPEGKRPRARHMHRWECNVNTLWAGDADLRLYITAMQDG